MRRKRNEEEIQIDYHTEQNLIICKRHIKSTTNANADEKEGEEERRMKEVHRTVRDADFSSTNPIH